MGDAVEHKLSFDAYVSLRKIPVLHVPGMRVFAERKKLALATVNEWDTLFSSY